LTLSVYDCVKGQRFHATTPQFMPRRKPETYTLAPTPEELARRFLAEAIAATAGVPAGQLSVRELHEIIRERRYSDDHDALRAWFGALEPQSGGRDFNGTVEMPAPAPLKLFVDSYTLNSFFRAWLRREGIDPDRVAPTDATNFRRNGRRGSVERKTGVRRAPRHRKS
jgi:hypothetical protein